MSGPVHPGLNESLHQVLSIFMQRELFSFVDFKSGTAAPAQSSLQTQAQLQTNTQTAQLPAREVRPAASELLSVLTSPALLGSKTIGRNELAFALKLLAEGAGAKPAPDSQTATQPGRQNGLGAAMRAGVNFNAPPLVGEGAIRTQPGGTAADSALAQQRVPNGGEPGNAASRGEIKSNQNPAASSGATVRSDARAASASANAGEAADSSDPGLRSLMRDRSTLALLLSYGATNSASAEPGKFELPVILNAGMIPGAEMMKPPLVAGALAKITPDQVVNYLLQAGVSPALLPRIRKLLEKIKGNKKLMGYFLMIFTALNAIAERIVEELSNYLEDEDEIRDKLTYADAHGFHDDRRRVYLG